jgi:hypothetical protein
MIGLVQRAAVMAAAGGLATAFVHPRQSGRQHRASRGESLQATVQHPADPRRVARDTHRRAPGISGKPMLYRGRPEKPEVRRKKSLPGRTSRLNRACTLDLRYRQRATNSVFLRAADKGAPGVGGSRGPTYSDTSPSLYTSPDSPTLDHHASPIIEVGASPGSRGVSGVRPITINTPSSPDSHAAIAPLSVHDLSSCWVT